MEQNTAVYAVTQVKRDFYYEKQNLITFLVKFKMVLNRRYRSSLCSKFHSSFPHSSFPQSSAVVLSPLQKEPHNPHCYSSKHDYISSSSLQLVCVINSLDCSSSAVRSLYNLLSSGEFRLSITDDHLSGCSQLNVSIL